MYSSLCDPYWKLLPENIPVSQALANHYEIRAVSDSQTLKSRLTSID